MAVGFGLDQYGKIMQSCAPDDEDYRKTFNHYYRIRRGEGWQDVYYGLFAALRVEKEAEITEHLSFAYIINKLYEATKMVEASFSSKMLATLNPDMPILDHFVLENLPKLLDEQDKQVFLDTKRRYIRQTGEDKLQAAIALYGLIVEDYKKVLVSPVGKECIAPFKRALPSYAEGVTDTKILDCFLWGMRGGIEE